MSFNNTKTPTKGSVKGKQRYTVPTRKGKNGATEYYLTPELEAEFRRLYPITMNPVLMAWFGLSFSTLQRFKRKLGLEKDRRVILKKHAAQVKRICTKNGYYDSLKGKAPAPQCKEAYRRKVAAGFSSINNLKENNPRKYARYLKNKSEARRDLWRRERRRVEIGLEQKTGLICPQFVYSKSQLNHRLSAGRRGYQTGDKRELNGERYMIYYTADTRRSAIFERNLEADGFTVKPLPVTRRLRV